MMGHMLEKNADGQYNFVSRLVPAWHRLGKVFMRDIGFAEAVEEANLHYPVEVAPITVTMSNGIVIPSDQGFATVRADKNQILGHVGNTYAVLQNSEAFAPVEALVNAGIARIETAGVLREGKQAWMLVHIDPEELVRRAFDECVGDMSAQSLEDFASEVAPYMFFSNDHTGKASAWVRETWIRVVCANTWASAEASAEGARVQVQHSGNVSDTYANATNLLLNSIAMRFGAAAENRDALTNVHLSEPEFRRLILDPIHPIKHLEAKVRNEGIDATPWTVTAFEKALAGRERVSELWMQGEGHTGEPTAWFAFQGAVQYLDHEARGHDSITAQYDGATQRKKANVLSGLTAHCTGATALVL